MTLAVCKARFRVKILDCLGMKYTRQLFCLIALSLATLALAGMAFAQSDYTSGAASLNAYSANVVTENAAAGSASKSESNSDDSQSALLTLRTHVNEVDVLFIATDKHGKFVRDLTQTDFSILDDHKPPQAILNFRRETDLPLHLGLLIDVSGSVGGRFDFEQEAATAFLQHTLRAGFDKAFVEGFKTHTQMAQDFTDDYSRLYWAVHRLHNGGGTALYDAVYHACKDKFLKDRSEHPVRKARSEEHTSEL